MEKIQQNSACGNYSAFTYFTESLSLNSSKTTKHKVIKLCMRQSHQNCEVLVESPFLYHIWKVLIWNTAITVNGKCLSLLCDGEGTFHYDCEKYIWDLAPGKLIIQRNMRNQWSRSQKRSLSAKKLNVTILILRSMVKTPCGYDIRLRRYLRKTIP